MELFEHRVHVRVDFLLHGFCEGVGHPVGVHGLREHVGLLLVGSELPGKGCD